MPKESREICIGSGSLWFSDANLYMPVGSLEICVGSGKLWFSDANLINSCIASL